MPIDLNDPAILQLLEQYLSQTADTSSIKFEGSQVVRPVMSIEHIGRADGFDIFASCLKLTVSTLAADDGTAAEGLIISGTETLGNLVRIFNQQDNLIDYTHDTFVISYDGRVGLFTERGVVLDGRLHVEQGDDMPCLVVRAFAGTVEDLLQVFNDADVQILWIDHSGQLYWQDSQTTVFQFPGGQPVPDVNELIAWNFDPALSGGTAPLVEQSVYLQKFYCPRPSTLSSVMFNVSNAVAIGGSASYVGLYSTSGVKLAETADVNTQFESTGMKTVSFTTPYVADTGYYYTAILVGNNPGLGPDLSSTGAAVGLNNANLSAATYRWAIGPTGQTTLPSSITMSSNTSAAGVTPWIGVK